MPWEHRRRWATQPVVPNTTLGEGSGGLPLEQTPHRDSAEAWRLGGFGQERMTEKAEWQGSQP